MLVDQEALKRVEQLNDGLSVNGQPFKLAVVSIDDTELLEKNARYMPAEMFRNLVQNVKRDGGLSSVPFCYKEGDKYRVLSGNHRVMAAMEAGLKEVLVMYTDEPLTRQEQVAIQLSHNAIEGQDDPATLKALWDEIEEVDWKLYSGLDDKLLKELEKVTLEPLAEVSLDYRTASFVFLPEEMECMERAFEEAMTAVADKDIYLARIQEFGRLLDALDKTYGSYNIKNSATALMIVLDIFERHLTDLSEGWEEREATGKDWIPLASVLGTDSIPAPAAQVIKRAIGKMMDTGQVTKKNLWQALEYWAAEYLAGC